MKQVGLHGNSCFLPTKMYCVLLQGVKLSRKQNHIVIGCFKSRLHKLHKRKRHIEVKNYVSKLEDVLCNSILKVMMYLNPVYLGQSLISACESK